MCHLFNGRHESHDMSDHLHHARNVDNMKLKADFDFSIEKTLIFSHFVHTYSIHLRLPKNLAILLDILFVKFEQGEG